MKRKRASNANKPFKRPRTTSFVPTQVITTTNRPPAPRPRLLAARVPAALIGSGKETKSVDFPIAANTPQTDIISTTATFLCVNTVQEGAGFYNRIGRRITMQSLHVTGMVFTNQGVTPGSVDEYLRIMVVYDRQPNGATPAIADLLLDYDNAGATSTKSFSHININNADRWQVLRDIRLQIPNDAGNLESGEAPIIDYSNRGNVNEFIRLNGLETHYKATTNPGAIGDISSGALWVITFGNVAAATAAYQFKWTARLRYSDN